MLESVQGQVASIVYPNIALGSPSLFIIEHFIQLNIHLLRRFLLFSHNFYCTIGLLLPLFDVI